MNPAERTDGESDRCFAPYPEDISMVDGHQTMDEFAALVKKVMDSLPKEWAKYLENVVVDVAEEPTREMLLSADMTEEEIDAGETAFGLFEPFQLPDVDLDFTEIPHRLWIFKNPHEQMFPDLKQRRIEVRKTVWHELAHHFGFTDRDLEAFDNTENPFDDEL